MGPLHLIKAFSQVRRYQLAQIDGISAEMQTYIPKGFRNHLHWQMGHVIAETDNLLLKTTGERQLPTSFQYFFANGTSPNEWTGEPPTWKELAELLLSQCNQVRDAIGSEKSDSAYKLEPHLYHEWLHAGIINTMVKLL